MGKTVKKTLVLTLILVGLLTSGGGIHANSIDMEFRNAPLADVFHVLGELAGYNVLIDPTVTGSVSFYLNNLSVQSALDLVSRTTGFGYVIEENTLIVAANDKLQREFATTEFVFIILENIDAADANRLVKVIFPQIDTYTDLEHNVLVLSGLVKDVSAATKLAKQYDLIGTGTRGELNLAQTETQPDLVQNRITIRYGDGEKIRDFLKSQWRNRDFLWEPNLSILTAITTIDEWSDIVIIVSAQDIPQFSLKGIVQNGDRTVTLVEYRGATQLVAVGQSLDGWFLESVSGKDAQFVQGERSFTIQLGR